MTPVRRDDDGTYVDVAAFTDEAPATESPRSTAAPQAPRRRKPPKALLVVLGLILGLGIVWTVYNLGEDPNALPAGHPDTSTAAPAASAAPATSARPLDEALVTQLKAKVQANPADVESLRALAVEYHRVGQFAEAALWQKKIVDQNPQDADARLILGVAYYNDSQFQLAEEQWLKVAEMQPKNPDPWYNLGFLYLSLEPPQDAKAEAAWQKVIDIDPNSELAATVSSHLDRLNTTLPANVSASPSATPTPSK